VSNMIEKSDNVFLQISNVSLRLYAITAPAYLYYQCMIISKNAFRKLPGKTNTIKTSSCDFSVYKVARVLDCLLFPYHFHIFDRQILRPYWRNHSKNWEKRKDQENSYWRTKNKSKKNVKYIYICEIYICMCVCVCVCVCVCMFAQ